MNFSNVHASRLVIPKMGDNPFASNLHEAIIGPKGAKMYAMTIKGRNRGRFFQWWNPFEIWRNKSGVCLIFWLFPRLFKCSGKISTVGILMTSSKYSSKTAIGFSRWISWKSRFEDTRYLFLLKLCM